MMKESIEDLVKEYMKTYAKERKAKVSAGSCIYKKEGDYFWYIWIYQYSSLRYCVNIGIKPWKYDELLFNIAHPNKKIHFTDKMRWCGFYAMSSYKISEKYYPIPLQDTDGNLDLQIFSDWCKNIYNEAIQSIDDFCEMIKVKYKDLDEFHIANADSDILMAAFAYIVKMDFKNAERMLLIAQKEQKVFYRSYGSIDYDLRDLLLGYCRAKQADNNA